MTSTEWPFQRKSFAKIQRWINLMELSSCLIKELEKNNPPLRICFKISVKPNKANSQTLTNANVPWCFSKQRHEDKFLQLRKPGANSPQCYLMQESQRSGWTLSEKLGSQWNLSWPSQLERGPLSFRSLRLLNLEDQHFKGLIFCLHVWILPWLWTSFCNVFLCTLLSSCHLP